MKIAIVTDSSSGMTKEMCPREDLFIVPMPFIVNGEGYFEDINMTQPEFYKLLEDKNTVVSTSQPSIYAIEELWDEVLENYDFVIHMPLSSGLTKAVEAAQALANEERFAGKVFVVDNKRVSITLREAVESAFRMIDEGMDVNDIVKWLMDTSMDSSIYIMVPTLKYLKRGGRVTAAGAALGTLLNIKPVLQIQGGKLDAYKKVASIDKAKNVMIKAIIDDVENRFKDIYDAGELIIDMAHTQNVEEAEEFKAQLLEKLPGAKFNYINPLSLIISCHIGPGSLAIGCSRVYQGKK